jgi:hypothetical protein
MWYIMMIQFKFQELTFSYIFSCCMTVVLHIYSNQPEIYEQYNDFVKAIIKWWKHHKRKRQQRNKTKRAGYYVPGTNKLMAKVKYIHAGTTGVRTGMKT